MQYIGRETYSNTDCYLCEFHYKKRIEQGNRKKIEQDAIAMDPHKV